MIEPIESGRGNVRDCGRGRKYGPSSNNIEEFEPASSSTLTPPLLDYHYLNCILSALLERLYDILYGAKSAKEL